VKNLKERERRVMRERETRRRENRERETEKDVYIHMIMICDDSLDAQTIWHEIILTSFNSSFSSSYLSRCSSGAIAAVVADLDLASDLLNMSADATACTKALS